MENIKSKEDTGGALASAPLDSFFLQGQKNTIPNFRGGILRVGEYAQPVLKYFYSIAFTGLRSL